MPAAAIALFVVAHLFDYVSFLVMTSRHGLAAEANPVVVGLSQTFGLPGLTLAKVGSVIFLAAIVLVLAPRRRKSAAALLMVGIFVGVVGGVSNVASI